MKIELDEKQVEFMTRALRVLSVELADSDPLQARYANETRVYLQQELDKKVLKQQLILCGVVKSFTAEEVVSELKENETLDDAISFFNSQK